MRYDEGYGRRGGWEQRMPEGGRGWDRGYPDPRRGGDPVDRPWVGGYREGYQGGSGGYALGTSGPLYERYDAFDDGARDRERGYRRPRGRPGRGRPGSGYFVRARAGGYDADFGGPGGARPGFGRLGHLEGGRDRGYGGDYGGSRGGGYGRDYDLPFRNEGRPEDYHPRYSPVGGIYAPMGGSRAAYRAGHVPRALTDTWTSEWTRWF